MSADDTPVIETGSSNRKYCGKKDEQGDWYSQNGNDGIGHMSGGVIEDGAKVAGKYEEKNNNQSPKMTNKIASHVNVNLNQQDKVNSSEAEEKNQKIKASVKQGDTEYSAEAPTVEEVIKCMTSLKELFGMEVEDISRGSIKFVLKGSEQGANNIVKLFESGELYQLLKQRFNLELEDVKLIDSDGHKNNQKLLSFTIAGNVSQSDIDFLKAELIDTSKDNQDIKNEEEINYDQPPLILKPRLLSLVGENNHLRQNATNERHSFPSKRYEKYNKKSKGNSFSQHGNHGVGNMSGGKISGNAIVAGKIVNNITKKPVKIAFAALIVIGGTVGIIFSSEKYIINNQGGIIEEGATVANKLTIYEGDPPEVRQRKLEQAKKLIAEEVFTNISNMDARLIYLADVLEDDNFDKSLQEVRNKVAPSFSEIFDSSYRHLIRQQEISSLRSAFVSRPLHEIREPLIQVLVDGNADPEKVRAFYNNITEVQDASESLFRELSTAAQETSTDPKIIAYQEKSVQLAIETLINRSQTAHLYGLSMLSSLEIPLPNAEERLSYLQYLKPDRLVSQEKVTQLLEEQIKETQRLIKERIAISKEVDIISAKQLDDYEKINDKLIVQPSDTWNEVVTKATILREFGRTSEAVAAFSRYGDMFAEKDPTAKQYSGTAQQFTIQLNHLKVKGGVYIYEVIEGGVADKAGLKVGDIIIGYSDSTITRMNDIIEAQQKAIAKDDVRLTYLRMNDTGMFERQTITVKAGSLGARLMPI